MSTRKKSNSPSSKRDRGRRSTGAESLEPGRSAHGTGFTLQSYEVGALPLVNHLLERMQLEPLLREYLPADDPRCEFPTSRALLILIRNVLLSREPIYAVGEWAARFAPDLFDVWPEQLPLLQDDRFGRCLTRLFSAAGPELILAVVRHVITEFQVCLDELHNDSTTVSFYGAYADAAEEGRRLGRATHAITWGHNKDHRPDLKQLLYTLTVSHDGGVPVYFTSHSGNVVDDQTHQATWDLLCQLVGSPDFLYVADCKLASEENLAYIARRGGRFVTVMPRTHGEDQQFRTQLRQSPEALRWQLLYEVRDEEGDVLDRLFVCADEWVSSDGYRLLWYRSTRKVDLDQATRARRVQRAMVGLAELRERLLGPRTRFRQRAKVEQAVEEILTECEAVSWIRVDIEEREEASYRQAQPGRPNKHTKYKKETRPRYYLTWELDVAALAEAEREDGIFPLLSNDRQLSAEEILRAYKRQPLIEKRFSQFKTDFAVAPVYLQDIGRIQGLLAVYLFVLLVQTLLERELRRAMAREELDSLPLYPEGRACSRPTTHRVVEVFEPIQRHVLTFDDGNFQILVTELTPLQRQIIQLLGPSPDEYGR
jgi:transposase